jgi:hypothetical protein
MSSRKARPTASIGPRVGRLGRKVRQAPVYVQKEVLAKAEPRQAAVDPPKGEQWVADAERLLNTVVVFAYRAAGSWLHGWLSLFRLSPSQYLLKKEADGQVLSWASVLVATSTLAGVLFPVASAGVTLPEWAQAMSGLANAQNYLTRSLPILGLGLVLCFVAWLACLMVSRSNVAGTRLLVSTYYALSLMTFLLAFAIDMLIDVAVEASVLPARTKNILLSVSWFSTGFTVCFFSLGVVTAWTVLRAAGRAAGRAHSRFAKLAWFSSLPAVGLTVFLPSVLGLSALFVTEVAPALADYLNPKAFKDPLSDVSIAPLPVSCRTSDSPKETRTLDCLLAAETSGEGFAFVDVGGAALFASSEPLGEWQQERYRFRRENKVWRFGADKYVEHSFFAEHALGEVAPVNPSHRVDDKVILEPGKPLAWMLRFNLAKACGDEKLKKLMQRLDAGSLLYVRIEALRPRPGRNSSARKNSNPAPERFEAIGPWELPVYTFSSACINLHR